nr:cyclase family protein [Microtetraspora sp. NBRC 13810]
MILDLSVPIVSGMPVYPGDPEVRVDPALTVAADGANVLGLHLGSHTGTHVDAPFHIDDSLPTLDELPLDHFVGPVAVADVRGLPPRTPIPAAAVAPHLGTAGILLVATGWSRYWGTGDYLAHPFLSAEAAELIAGSGVRTVGVDAFSVDPTPAAEFPAHHALCHARMVIVENLAGLGRVIDAQAAGRTVEVSLLPIRVAGGDGAPVRAVARVSGRAPGGGFQAETAEVSGFPRSRSAYGA